MFLLRIFSLATAFLFAPFAAANTVILDGQPYTFSLARKPLKDCSTDAQLEEMRQIVGIIGWTVKTGMAVAYCKITCTTSGNAAEYCNDFCTNDIEQQKENRKYAMISSFSEFREYPPHSKDLRCKLGRDACEDKCNEISVFTTKECTIGCNQHELYNK